MVLNQIRDEVDIIKKNNQIEEQELLDAMKKPNGFFSNEKNIAKVGELLNDKSIDGADEQLLISLKDSFYGLKGNIISQYKISSDYRMTDEDRNILEIYKKILGSQCEEDVQEINDFIANQENLKRQDEIDRQNAEIDRQNNEIQNIYDTLDSKSQGFLNKLLGESQDSWVKKIDNYLLGDINLSDKDTIKGINVLNNLIQQDKERYKILQNKVNDKVLIISHEVNKEIAYGGNDNCYGEPEIMAIQLWANVCYGEHLEITGIRGGNREINQTNKGNTNYYIYKLELQTRSDISSMREKYQHLVSVENVDDVLSILSDEQKSAVLKSFLLFYLNEVRFHGKYFENKIGSDVFQKLLTYMVSAESSKGISVGDEINNKKKMKAKMEREIQIYQGISGDLDEEIAKKIEIYKNYIQFLDSEISSLEEFGETRDLSEYYNTLVVDIKHDIVVQEAENVDIDRTEYVNNKIGEIYDKIQQLDKKLQEGNIKESEYNKEYKKVLSDFVILWSDYRYKEKVERIPLFSIIFSKVYTHRDMFSDNDLVMQRCGILKNELYEDEGGEGVVLDMYYMLLNIESGTRSNRWEETHTQVYEEGHRSGPVADNTRYVTRTPTYEAEYEENEYGEPVYDDKGNRVIRGYNTHYTQITMGPTGIDEPDRFYQIDRYYTDGSHDEEYRTEITRGQYRGKKGNFPGENVTIDPSATVNYALHKPDPNKLYANVPEELREKLRNRQAKVELKDGNLYVYEFDGEKNIKVYKFDKKEKKLKYEKSIDRAFYERAIAKQAASREIWRYEHGDEYRNIQKQLKGIQDFQKLQQSLIFDRQNEKLSESKLKQLQDISENAVRTIKNLRAKRSEFVALKKSLQALNQKSAGEFKNPFETDIEILITTVDSMLEICTEETQKGLEEFARVCKTDIKPNSTWRERFSNKSFVEWVIDILSLVSAVAVLFFPPAGAVGLGVAQTLRLGLTQGAKYVTKTLIKQAIKEAGKKVIFRNIITQSARMTFTGMASGELLRLGYNRLGLQGTVEIDGQTYVYDKKLNSSLDNLLSGKTADGREPEEGENPRWEFLKASGCQFIKGTLTTALFMYGGGLAGNAISKRGAKLKPGTPAFKIYNTTARILNHQLRRSDYFTQNAIESISSAIGKKGAFSSFLKESGEEVFEETVENLADGLGPGAAFIAQVMHCIKPRGGLALERAGVSYNFDNVRIQSKTLNVETTYSKGHADDIINYYKSIDKSLKIEYNEATGEIHISGKSAKTNGVDLNGMACENIDFTFIASDVSSVVRNLSDEDMDFAGINYSRETGEVFYTSEMNLRLLGELYESHGQGRVIINTDGSAKIILTGGGTIELSKKTENDVAGGSSRSDILDFQLKIQNMDEVDIINLINGTGEINLEGLSANDMRLLMYKASNMGLHPKTIAKLGTAITHSLINNPNINPELKVDLKNYVNYLCYITEIQNIDVEGNTSNVESILNDIQQQINVDFKENSIMAKELNIEINKKKFELYKAMGNIDQAQTMINKIQNLNTELLSNDYNNFKYRRGLLEANLLQIQLGGEIGQTALDGLNEKAQEIWDKTETIGGRTDTETLISKIESGILLGKSETELQPYLDFLALAEHGAGINILGAVIQTINTTFDSDGAKGILKKYAADVTDAGTASNNADLLKAGEKAKTISDTYEQMRNNLDNDSNGIYSNEIKMRLEKFVKERNVSSILDFGNNFSHPTILLNPQATGISPVMSIEIGDVDYQAAKSVLENEIKVNLDGNRNNFSELIQNFNQSVDKWIRETYGTANLQELNSPEHRALFDYIAEKYMEGRRGSVEASLTNLSQLFGVKGLQDCRLHAFTKQLFFDTWKKSQLESLEKSKVGEKTPAEISEINKKIKLIENTNMTFLDASFSGNVDMNNKYVARTENGYMMAGNQNNVIEEHTFNLIEIPVLDADGNIEYNTDGTIHKKVCFADSFYQGIMENGVNTDKVYDLSFTGEDIGHEFYGKTGENINITATIVDINGNHIVVNINPLARSIQGRGDNIVGSSIETRGPSLYESARLNNQYGVGSELVSILGENWAEIQGNLQNELHNLELGQPVNLEHALTSSNGHKVVEWQANQIRRAFDLYGKVPESQKGTALVAIQTMITNTVTQNVVDFTGAKGGATEFLQTEGVFFEAMQVFNDVYKAEIKEATKQLDPNNPDSIQRLQNAIKTYQEIFTNDMGSFFERSQKTALKDGKRGTEYHRNNFEKVANRYQSDMKVYLEVVRDLESVGLFDQAYEIRKYMVDQEEILLEHSDKLLGDMIDFKKVKKEMKGPQGREWYNQLKGIQGKNTSDIILEFQRKGLDRDKIKDMTGMDANAELTQESLNQAIANIEESGLKEYYDIIGLVFNPEILAIQMENTVYSRGGYSTSEGGKISFNIEAKEDYIARKQAEREVSRQLNDNMTSGEISQIIYDQVLKNLDPSLLAGNAKINIQTEIQNLVDLCSQCGITGQQAYNIGKTATEALIFQTTESQTRIMGDHGINHISGNIAKLNTYLDAGVKGGKIPSGEVGKYKLMGALTHIFHDVGYAATISKGSGSFDGSAIHPFTSKVFFDANIKGLLGNSGINTELISKAIEAHDGIRLNFSTPEATFLSFVNLSDNMALGVDKMAQVWSNPKLLNHISTLYALDKAGIDIKEANNRIIQNIRQDNSISQAEQETLISAISELSGRGLDNIDFWSISPFTAMEFTGNTPTLSMFKGANLMLVAEVCGIDPVQLQEAIDSRNRDAVINLIKGRKFGSQIIKPLGDYCDIYSIHDANGNEYPKVEKKKDGKTYMEYDWDNIKADLLLGNTVMLKDGDNLVLNYKYENSTDVSRQAEQNSVYGNINTADMLRQGVETMKTLNTSAVIQELGSLNKTTKGILDNIKEKKSIDTDKAIGTIEEAIGNINMSITANDVTVNKEFKEYFESLKSRVESLKTKLKENNHADIKPIAEDVQKGINILSSFLVQE